MRRAIWLPALVLIVSVAMILPFPPAPVEELRDSFKRELEPTAEPALKQLVGKATFYDATRNHAWYTQAPRKNAAKYHQTGGPFVYYAAASPRLRALRMFKWGQEPYRVIVSNEKTGVAIIAWVVDTCACVGGSIIDLSPEGFTALGVGLKMGIQKVRVTVLP